MTPLEDRLRSLANAPLPGPTGIEELRRRARRRNRRRRTLAVAIPLVVAGLVAAAATAATRVADHQRVNAGPGPDRPAPPDPSRRVTTTTTADGSGANASGLQLFGVSGVDVQADPTTDLRDGDQIDVLVTGFEPLDGAVALMCAGDVTAESAASDSCDLTPLSDQFERNDGPDGITGRATVTAARIIHLPGSSESPGDLYDCAREPAGCVLAIAPLTTPVRAVVVPVSFVDVPLAAPSMTLDRMSGLHSGDQVAVTTTGLRPNTSYGLTMCRAIESQDPDPREPSYAPSCDVVSDDNRAVLATDSLGDASGTVVVQAGFYGYDGRVDCTSEPCSVLIEDGDGAGQVFASEPISFAVDETFPQPVLVIDVPGPYVDGQVVTLSGTGFPPGLDIGRDLGICPADKDPAIEERCTYPLAFSPVAVAPDGTFSTEFRLSDSSGLGRSCITGPGCLLSWIISHGPAVVSLPLQFAS